MSQEIFSAKASRLRYQLYISTGGDKRKEPKERLADGGHGMSRRKQRERRSIHDTQTLDANDSGAGIDDGFRIVDAAQGTRGSGMPDGVEVLADVILDLLVGGDFLAGIILVADNEALHGFGGVELPYALEARYHDVDVGLLRQVVGFNERGNAGVGAGDGEIPT